MTRRTRILEQIAERIACYFGSVWSIVFHTVFFTVYLSLPYWAGITKETMLLSLTTIVSLEAIYLALFNQLITNKIRQEGTGSADSE